MPLIKRRGEMWARNTDNMNAIPGRSEGGFGVYVLYDGSTPVYIGMGAIRKRVWNAYNSKRRGQMWDHFSWYVPTSPELIREIEALLIRMLPPHLRILNRQRGKLVGAQGSKQKNPIAEPINRVKFLGRSKKKIEVSKAL